MGDLAWVADRIAIQDCLLRYCRGIDRRDADLVRSVWWPEATADYGGYKGSGPDFGDHAVASLSKSYHVTQHTILNSTVDLDGDVAHTETYIHAYHLSRPEEGKEQTVFLFAGRYLDRLEKRDGEWRIAKRVLLYDFDWVEPIGGRMPAAWSSQFNQGRDDRSDLSYRS